MALFKAVVWALIFLTKLKLSYVYKTRYLCKSLIKNHAHFFAGIVIKYGEIILF